ncbi:general substrate transporter, partial [Aureobasidium melanogenum]
MSEHLFILTNPEQTRSTMLTRTSKAQSPSAEEATSRQQPQEASARGTPFTAWFLGLVASIGGFMFGYSSGQISGYFDMDDFCHRFGVTDVASGGCTWPAVRQGAITSLLCAGALIGAIVAGRLADIVGRRLCVSGFALFCMVGSVIEITSQYSWVQFAVGRLVEGVGIGGLSVVVPMYQSECAPKTIRGILIASYQLFVTLGIWVAAMINYGTHNVNQSSAQWRIPNGISFAWALILGCGVLFLPESPRHSYRCGRHEEARNVIARLAGLSPYHEDVDDQINDIQQKIFEESSSEAKWHEVFTGPRMMYRTILGMVLQIGQQLTGANFFFYYGTTVFAAVGLTDSYVTQIILNTVNVACTLASFWIIANVGRRKALMAGAAWSFMCFMVYSLVGHLIDPTTNATSGNVLIVFSCFFIAAFATTWGPLAWAIVAELYPARYRAQCMALATASNWLFNFLISFFTKFIIEDIGYLYGLVFAGCCFALFWIVFFFVIESKDRSLEEIDTMYITQVNPRTSNKWVPHSAKTAQGILARNSDVEKDASVADK